MSPAARLPIAFGAAGLAVVLATAVPTLGQGDGRITSYGDVSPGAAVLQALTGALLFAAATVLSTDPRRRASAVAMFFLGVAWSAAGTWAASDGAPSILANLGLLLAPMVAPAALFVVASLTRSRRGRVAGVSVAMVALTSGVVLWLVRDPFLDRYCWQDCFVEAFAPFADVERARTAWNVVLALGVVCALATIVLCLEGLRAPRSGSRALAAALAPGIVLGVVLGTSNVMLLVEPAENPERRLFAMLFVARAAALTAFAAGVVAAVALRRRFIRDEIARLVREPAQVGTDLGASLALAIDDPELRVGYPLSDGSVVDADGRPIAFDDGATRLLRGGELVALVGSRAGVPRAALERELGPAGRLSLANERLRAEELARLRELTELRRRIVATGDETRRRLERDLHDGAQQRLLALTFDLRVAVARAQAAEEDEIAAQLQRALEQLGAATAELREVAHGIFPTVLTTSGIVAAVETLADSRPLALTLRIDPARRLPPDVETAAYEVISEAIAHTSAPVSVEIADDGAELVLTVDDAHWVGGVVSVEDRIGAVGGAVEWSGRRLEARLPVSRADT